jgi:hypothetical protein
MVVRAMSPRAASASFSFAVPADLLFLFPLSGSVH